MVRFIKQKLAASFAVIAIILVVALLPALLLLYAIYSAMLYIVVWLLWCSRGRNVLLVYSNSPQWQIYIEAEIIPRLPENTIILNWSERATWPGYSLATQVFWHFAGAKEFNPVVIVFKPFCWTRTFRFWRAFRARKQGQAVLLLETQDRLFKYMERVGIRVR